MTSVELSDLLVRRAEAYAAMDPHRTLREMTPAERARADRLSREFREADAAIVAELRKRGRPVRVGNSELRLTKDRLNFVELDRATGSPDVYPSERSRCGALLYRYPAAEVRA